MNGTAVSLATVVLDCADSDELAEFYARLLGWEVALREPGWALMRSPTGGTGLAFQAEPWYRQPVWPERTAEGAVEGAVEQTKMLHLDLQVADLEAGVAHAVYAGATLCEHQPQEGVRVLLDPAGHPFCLFTD